jgi:hypothetical protein
MTKYKNSRKKCFRFLTDIARFPVSKSGGLTVEAIQFFEDMLLAKIPTPQPKKEKVNPPKGRVIYFHNGSCVDFGDPQPKKEKKIDCSCYCHNLHPHMVSCSNCLSRHVTIAPKKEKKIALPSKENNDWADLFYGEGFGFHIWDIDKGGAGIKVSKFSNMSELKMIKDLIAECRL